MTRCRLTKPPSVLMPAEPCGRIPDSAHPAPVHGQPRSTCYVSAAQGPAHAPMQLPYMLPPNDQLPAPRSASFTTSGPHTSAGRGSSQRCTRRTRSTHTGTLGAWNPTLQPSPVWMASPRQPPLRPYAMRRMGSPQPSFICPPLFSRLRENGRLHHPVRLVDLLQSSSSNRRAAGIRRVEKQQR